MHKEENELKKRRGFTLVELLVVIAILAILATVSVVAYLGFTDKAKESNDIGIITQLNTLLKAEETTSGKPKTMHETVLLAEENGLLLEKYPNKDGNEFVYNHTDNEYYLINKKNEVIFPENEVLDLNSKELWKFVDNEEELNAVSKDGYSVYLTSTFTEGTNKDNTLTVKKGFDAGFVQDAYTVTYDNSIKQKAVFHTNGGEVIVNGASGANGDTVYHYGEASIVRVNSVGSHSYHEFGIVSSLNIKDGRVVIESGSKTTEVLVTSDAVVDNVKVEIDNGATVERVIDDTNQLPNTSISGQEVPQLQATHVKNITELDNALYTKKAKYVIFDNDINTNDLGFDGNLITADSTIINGNGYKLYGHRTYPSGTNPVNNYDYKATLRLTTGGQDTNAKHIVELNNLTIENDVTTGTATTLAVNTFISDLKLSNVKLINKATNGKPICIVNNGQFNAPNINVEINNSILQATDSGYAIYNNRKATINVNQSTFYGWAAIYMKENSKGSIYNLKETNLNCTNKYDGTSNNFGTFAIATGYTTINLDNCKVQNLMEGTARHALLSFGYAEIDASEAKEIKVDVTGDDTLVVGDLVYDSWGIKPLPYTLSLTGGLYSDKEVSKYVAATHMVKEENTLYRIVRK